MRSRSQRLSVPEKSNTSIVLAVAGLLVALVVGLLAMQGGRNERADVASPPDDPSETEWVERLAKEAMKGSSELKALERAGRPIPQATLERIYEHEKVVATRQVRVGLRARSIGRRLGRPRGEIARVMHDCMELHFGTSEITDSAIERMYRAEGAERDLDKKIDALK